jgi:hypothetical protein
MKNVLPIEVGPVKRLTEFFGNGVNVGGLVSML